MGEARSQCLCFRSTLSVANPLRPTEAAQTLVAYVARAAGQSATDLEVGVEHASVQLAVAELRLVAVRTKRVAEGIVGGSRLEGHLTAVFQSYV